MHAEGPGLIEARDRQAAGEHHHDSSGEIGGDWRARGRAPERTVGVGHSGSAAQRVPGFRRTPASYEPEFAALFTGVRSQELIGGWEPPADGAEPVHVDRSDPTAGTPPSATLLARAGIAGQAGAVRGYAVAELRWWRCRIRRGHVGVDHRVGRSEQRCLGNHR